MRWLWLRIRWLITKVPVYGQLINSERRSLSSAGIELLIATIFSLFPVWLYPIIMMVGFGDPFWQNAETFIENGEFFLFSSALVGPLIYSITKKYGDEKEPDESNYTFPRIRAIQFPYGFWFVIISVLICLFSAVFFGLMRVNSETPLAGGLDEATLFSTSVLMYLFTLSCFFCVSVYRLNLEGTTEAFGEDTKDLMRQWERRDD